MGVDHSDTPYGFSSASAPLGALGHGRPSPEATDTAVKAEYGEIDVDSFKVPRLHFSSRRRVYCFTSSNLRLVPLLSSASFKAIGMMKFSYALCSFPGTLLIFRGPAIHMLRLATPLKATRRIKAGT